VIYDQVNDDKILSFDIVVSEILMPKDLTYRVNRCNNLQIIHCLL